MSRTVTALFDDRQQAEAAKSRLQSSNIDADRIRILDKSSTEPSSGSSDSGERKGFFGSLSDMFMPDEDRYAYREGLSRGGYLLCTEVDDDQADEAVSILEQADSVDFDERENSLRSEGWQGWSGNMSGQGYGAGMQETGRTIEEERIPLVEEELRVGKREVDRGGARVRSYVRETPVSEQVNLREEHVSVERRPVNERVDESRLNSGDLLRDRTIEMTETGEEAVVGKEACVTEEVVIRKTAEERTEQVSDTVRRTEVDVDNDVTDADRSAFFEAGRTSYQANRENERNDDPAWRS